MYPKDVSEALKRAYQKCKDDSSRLIVTVLMTELAILLEYDVAFKFLEDCGHPAWKSEEE